jgi:L-2-hydroxyglutarate oxidase
MINAAGQGALDIAQEFGYGKDLLSVPIKGRYAISDKPLDKYKMLVYPVPVKGAYVLGVHSTITVDGRLKVGPTVFPAFA